MRVYLTNGQVLVITTEEYKELFPLKHLSQAEIEEKIVHLKKYKHHRKQRFPRKGQSNWSAFLAKLRRQRKEEHESNPAFTKNCEICNNSYISRTRRQKFCSIKCKKEFLHQQYLAEKVEKNNQLN